MTDPLTPEEQAGWFAAVSDVFAQIEGIYRVYGVKGAETDPKVVPMSRELPVGSVVGILAYDSGEITPGSWERQEHTLDAAIWVPATAETLDKAYTLAVAYVDRVMAVFPGRGRAGAEDESIQSVVVTGFETIEGRAWADREAQREYVVLPFSIQVIREVVRRYVAA
jgi:hypothetical protein